MSPHNLVFAAIIAGAAAGGVWVLAEQGDKPPAACERALNSANDHIDLTYELTMVFDEWMTAVDQLAQGKKVPDSEFKRISDKIAQLSNESMPVLERYHAEEQRCRK